MPQPRWFAVAAKLFGYAAAVCLVTMMLLLVADVVLRSLVRIPIFGTFDLVELLMVAVIFLALPATFLRQENVVVDVIDHLVSPGTITLLRLVGAGMSLIFLLLMLWRMIQPALDTLAFQDHTLELEIPKFLHWLPILCGVACAILAIVAVLVHECGRLRPRKDTS